jgi:hypothetical protein
MGNCALGENNEKERENHKIYKEIIKELQERKVLC